MERSADDDSAKADGICNRFLTFLMKSLSLNQHKQGQAPNANSSSSSNHDEDHSAIQIEKATDMRSNDQKEEEVNNGNGMQEVAAAQPVQKKPPKGPSPQIPVMRVPSNINERSQLFIDDKKKDFAKGGN